MHSKIPTCGMDEETFAFPSVPSSPSTDPTLDAGGCLTIRRSGQFYDPEGDIILRASDMVDFRVYKVILALSSPFFKTIFSLPQTPDKDDDTPPIVPVVETGETIGLLLSFCYPVQPPKLATHEMSEIGDVLRAAMKYNMIAVVKDAREAFYARISTTRTDAIAGYAVACQLKWERGTHTAALACLKWPIAGFEVPELSLMTGLDYLNLLKFHSTTGEAITALFNQFEFLVDTCSKINPDPHECDSVNTTVLSKDRKLKRVAIRTWWSISKSQLAESFRNAPLGMEVLSLSSIEPALTESKCHHCKDKVLRGWEETKQAIISVIETEAQFVNLSVSWK